MSSAGLLMVDGPGPEQLLGAVGTLRGAAAADRLCAACVELVDIDAATISLVYNTGPANTTGTFGASSPIARIHGEVQFTLGEGPCLDSVRNRGLVAATELADETRWPAYTAAMLGHGIHSVYAIPIVLGGQHLGALDSYRHRPGQLTSGDMTALLMAAELAAMPLLDLLSTERDVLADPDTDLWTELGTLTRTDVNQATGMLIAQLGVAPAEALIRLRAHAYATGTSASDTARHILEHRLQLEPDQ